MFDLEEELLRLRDELGKEGVEYALCGGMAMAVHGLPRATVDIDLLVRAEDFSRVEVIAERLGYAFKAKPMSFASGTMEIRRISKIDPTDGETLMLDFLLVTPYSQSAWNTREVRQWRGAPLTVVSREGLILLKVSRSSDQDLVDIRKLKGDS